MAEQQQTLYFVDPLYGALFGNGAECFTCIILHARAALAAASKTGVGGGGNGGEGFTLNFVLMCAAA